MNAEEQKLDEWVVRERREFKENQKRDWKSYNEVPGLRLTIGDGKKQSDSFTLVTWCVSPEAAKKMIEIKGKNPDQNFFMFLAAIPEDRNDSESVICKIVPFNQMAEYLAFRRAGAHHVFGIVFRNFYPLNKLKRSLISKEGYPTFPVFDGFRAHELQCPLYQCICLPNVEGMISDIVSLARARVTVPKEFFAKERPEWLKNYVDGWYDKPSRDDCQFWRRGIFAFTAKPVVIVLLAVFIYLLCYPLCTGVKLFYALAQIFFGVRAGVINWKEVFDPKNVGEGACKRVFNPERFDRVRDCYLEGNIIGVPLVWFVGFLFLTAGSLAFSWMFGSLGWWRFVAGLGLTLLVISVAALIVWAVVKWFDKKEDPDYKATKKLLQQKKSEDDLVSDMEKMVCSTRPKTGTLADLPEEMRTFHLLVNAFKRTHCRPFAK